MPTLAAFLEVCEGRDFELTILDLKDDDNPTLTATVDVVRASPLAAKCLFMPRTDDAADRLRALAPGVRIGSFGIVL